LVIAGRVQCGLLAGGEVSPLAVRVCETESKTALCSVGPFDDLLGADRFAGRAQPQLPFERALRLPVGVQQEAPAERASTLLAA